MDTFFGVIDLEREIIIKGNKNIPFTSIEVKNKKECAKRNWEKGMGYGAIIGAGLSFLGAILGYYYVYSVEELIFNMLTNAIIYGCVGAFIGLFFKKKPIDIKLTVIDNEGDIIEINTNEDIYDKMKLCIYQKEKKDQQEKELLQKVQNIVQNKDITDNNISAEKQEIKQVTIKDNIIKKDQQTLDYVAKLKELKDLFDAGALDEVEYKTLKEDVLNKYRQTL